MKVSGIKGLCFGVVRTGLSSEQTLKKGPHEVESVDAPGRRAAGAEALQGERLRELQGDRGAGVGHEGQTAGLGPRVSWAMRRTRV